jgi:hypothetical protein
MVFVFTNVLAFICVLFAVFTGSAGAAAEITPAPRSSPEASPAPKKGPLPKSSPEFHPRISPEFAPAGPGRRKMKKKENPQ